MSKSLYGIKAESPGGLAWGVSSSAGGVRLCCWTTGVCRHHWRFQFTRILQPAYLSSRTVALVVLGSDSEDDGRPCRAVDVCIAQLGFGDCAWSLGPPVDSDEGQFTWTLHQAVPSTLPHSQIHWILHDLPGHWGRRLPGDVHRVSTLSDFDSRWCARESRLAGFELTDGTEVS